MDALLRRLAFLVEIADRRNGTDCNPRLGKTAMQKLLYLLQEGLGVEVGYHFSLYTYGPYDTGVMGDLDYAGAIGLLQLEYDTDEGYQIQPGGNADDLREERETISLEASGDFKRLFDLFGSLSARQLELRATLHYVAVEEPQASKGDLLERVHALKPKYDKQELEDALDKLVEAKFLSPPADSAQPQPKRRRKSSQE